MITWAYLFSKIWSLHSFTKNQRLYFWEKEETYECGYSLLLLHPDSFVSSQGTHEHTNCLIYGTKMFMFMWLHLYTKKETYSLHKIQGRYGFETLNSYDFGKPTVLISVIKLLQCDESTPATICVAIGYDRSEVPLLLVSWTNEWNDL